MLSDLPRNAICSLQLFMLWCLLTFWSCKPEFNSMHGVNCEAAWSGNKISYFPIARCILTNLETYRQWLTSTQSPWVGLRCGNFSKRKIQVLYKDQGTVHSHRIRKSVVVGQALTSWAHGYMVPSDAGSLDVFLTLRTILTHNLALCCLDWWIYMLLFVVQKRCSWLQRCSRPFTSILAQKRSVCFCFCFSRQLETLFTLRGMGDHQPCIQLDFGVKRQIELVFSFLLSQNTTNVRNY